MQIRSSPESIDGFEYDDFKLLDYQPHPAIKAPVAV
jgi:thymidylate synthase